MTLEGSYGQVRAKKVQNISIVLRFDHKIWLCGTVFGRRFGRAKIANSLITLKIN